MSLILDALRKLERDKDAREPGVLVVGSVPWGERRRSYRPLTLASLALVVLGSVGWWWWRAVPRPASAAPAAPAFVAPATPAAAPTESPSVKAAPTPPPAEASHPAAAPPSEARAPASPVAPPPRQLAVPDAGAPVRAPAEGPPGPSAARPAPDELRLNAITQRDGRPMALINDRLVFEGDSFDGVRILRIGEAEVEVEVRGQRRVLRF